MVQKNKNFSKKCIGIEKKCIFARSNYGAVAQSVEQRTENPCVGSSILSSTTERDCLKKTISFF